MADILWGLWIKLRLWFSRGQNWLFVLGKYLAIGFILVFVVGTMLGLVLEGMGYPELGGPILEFVNSLNNEIRSFVSGLSS